MTVEEAIALVEQLLERGRLTKVQEIVFRNSWDGKTYQEMAKDLTYDPGHIKDVGSELWQLLSKALGEKVTKNNLHGVLQRNTARQQNSTSVSPTPSDPIITSQTDWGEAIEVSHFYGRTTELETLHQWIVNYRCRIVALLGMGGMGKTALSAKLTEQLQKEFEYVTYRIITGVCEEIANQRYQFLNNYALTKAQSKEYIRQAQIRLIVRPIINRLVEMLGSINSIEHQLKQMLALLQQEMPLKPGYAAGNILNILCEINADLSHLDCSHLAIWQAYLADATLHKGTGVREACALHIPGGRPNTTRLSLFFLPCAKVQPLHPLLVSRDNFLNRAVLEGVLASIPHLKVWDHSCPLPSYFCLLKS